jgi:hypothetical protein
LNTRAFIVLNEACVVTPSALPELPLPTNTVLVAVPLVVMVEITYVLYSDAYNTPPVENEMPLKRELEEEYNVDTTPPLVTLRMAALL